MVFRCFSNCGLKVDPSARLRLVTSCSGKCDTTDEYFWTLFEITAWEDGDPVTKDQSHLLETAVSYDNLVIKENVLTPGKDYGVTVKVETSGAGEIISAYYFKTSSPPSGGNCSVSPTEGKALETRFEFKCKGWEDEDISIFYEVYYKTSETPYVLALEGAVKTFSVLLPEGESGQSYTIQTKVDVVNFLGTRSSVHFNVTVRYQKDCYYKDEVDRRYIFIPVIGYAQLFFLEANFCF